MTPWRLEHIKQILSTHQHELSIFFSGKQSRELKKNTVQNLEWARNGQPLTGRRMKRHWPSWHTLLNTLPLDLHCHVWYLNCWRAQYGLFGKKKKSHSYWGQKNGFVSYSWLPCMYLVFLFFTILSCVFVTPEVLEIEHSTTISYSFNINVIL